MTSSWDVFHSVRLEVDRGVSTEDVRARLLAQTLNGDDLIRPAGTTRWSRIAQVAFFADPQPTAPEPAPAPPAPEPPAPPILPPVATAAAPIRLVPLPFKPTDEPTPDPGFVFEEDVDEPTADFLPAQGQVQARVEVTTPAPAPAADRFAVEPDSGFETPVLPDDEAGAPDPPELADPVAAELATEDDAEDDPASDFTLSRNSTERVEELDLAAMVDVAFQLVLFFLVTASTVVFKTLEVPRPNEDKPPEAAAQSRAKSIDELEKDYILVEVDAEGAVKVDHIPVNADRAALVEKLRVARQSTGRKAMLLSADFATRHRNAVLAFDVASEIDLQIAIAQPTGKN